MEEDGVIRPRMGKGELELSPGGDTQLLKVKGDQGAAAIAAPGRLPKPELAGSTATYRNAYGPGADLVVTATPTGFRQDIVIRQRPSKDLKLRVPVDLPKGQKLGKDSDARPSVLDGKGTKAELPAAMMIDAAAMNHPDKGRTGTALVNTEGDEVVVTATADFLADPAVTYPVTVVTSSSHWVGAGVPADTFVSHSYPNGLSNSSLDRVIAGRSNSGTVTWRGYVRFDFPDELLGGTVENGDLRLWNHCSHTCSHTDSPGIVARMVTTEWTVSSLTWSNQPSVTTSGQVGLKGAYDENECPQGEGELWYSIEQMVQSWMDGTPHRGVQLSSASESVNQNWRWYRSSEYGGYDTYPFTPRGPVLIIDYEPPQMTDLAAVGWFFDDEPGFETTEDLERVVNDPEVGRASLHQPVAEDITEDQAIAARQEDGEEYEVSWEDILAEDPDVDPEDPTPTPPVDTTPPEVTATDPVAGAADVPVNARVVVRFSEPVDEVRIAVTDSSDASVAGDIVSNLEADEWTFIPAQSLTPQTTYAVEVSGALDNADNPLATPYEWSFTTSTTTSPPTPTPTPTPTPSPVPGLVAAYGMEEGAGTVVADASGQNNTGTARNTTWVSEGRHGKALSLNGTSSWVTVSDSPSLRLSTGMTLSAWVKPETVSGWRTVVMKELAGDGWMSYALYAASDSEPSGWVTTDRDDSAIGASSPLPINTWSHLAVTYDGSRLRLYVNGSQVGQTAASGSVDNDNGALRIGGNNLWGEHFRGLIDEVRVYNRAQSQAEIQTDMNTPIGAASVAGANSVPEGQALVATDSGTASADSGPVVVKMAVLDARMVDGKATTSTLTPRLAVWVSGRQSQQASVEVEVIHKPTKSARGKRVIWSGRTSRKDNSYRTTLRIPAGKLKNGLEARWRARATVDGVKGPWTSYQTLDVERQIAAAQALSTSPLPPAGDTPPAKAAGIYDRITTADCWNNRELAGRVKGWIKNHFSWCQIGKIEAQHERWSTAGEAGPPRVLTYYKAKVMLIGYTFTGKKAAARSKMQSRDILVEAYVFDQRTYTNGSGTTPLNKTLVLGMDIGNKPNCSHVSTWNGQSVRNQRSDTIANWKLHGRATFRFRCDGSIHPVKRKVWWGPNTYNEGYIDNDEKVTFGTLKAYANFPDWPATYKYVSNTGRHAIGNAVRCDSASYIRYKGGCIFHGAASWVKLQWGKKYDEAYNHYWNACRHTRAETYPTKELKRIPGCESSHFQPYQDVLHREFPGIRDTNQSNTYRRCKKMWPAYSSQNKQCDEYPFASTRERTWARTDDWNRGDDISLCPIAASDNGAAGRIMESHYYSKDRILVGDTFRIKFDPQGVGALKGRSALCGTPVRDP